MTRWLLVLTATAMGAALVLASWLAGDVGWGSIALEVGTGLLLVAVVFKLEERLREDTEESIESIRSDVDVVGAQVDELSRQVNADATEGFVAAVNGQLEGMFGWFATEPSIESLSPIVMKLRELNLPTATNLYPTDDCVLNVAADESWVRVKILPNGPNAKRLTKTHTVTWGNDDGFDVFVRRLGAEWAASGLYPGHEAFLQFNFPAALADTFRAQIEKKYNPS